jgi:hypothetical protein
MIADEISVYRRFYGASLIRGGILISRALPVTIAAAERYCRAGRYFIRDLL